MIRALLLVLVIGAGAGCAYTDQPQPAREAAYARPNTLQPIVTITRVRECEYIVARNGIVHAGDCPNPIHRPADDRLRPTAILERLGVSYDYRAASDSTWFQGTKRRVLARVLVLGEAKP